MTSPQAGARSRSLTASDADEARLRTFDIGESNLRQGVNVLSVEVHQVTATSSDLHFELGLSTIGDSIGHLRRLDSTEREALLERLASSLPPALADEWLESMRLALSTGGAR